MAASTSTTAPVRIVALGGLGEIGLNLMAIECAGRAIVIDCGVMFPDEPALGLRHVCPRDGVARAQSRRGRSGSADARARGSHRRARRICCAASTSPFTAPTSRSRSPAAGSADAEFDDPVDLRTIVPRACVRGGAVHGRADSRHAFDARIRSRSRFARPRELSSIAAISRSTTRRLTASMFDRERFAELGEEGVALLLSDSTNVERPGRSGSESSLKPVLRELTSRARGRFFLSAFSSHLHRIRQVVEVSREFGRRVVPLGRAMAESVRLGLETGQLPFAQAMFVEPGEAEFLDGHRLSYLTSGSQGEPLSALAKIAGDTHPRVRIEHGDVVVLSSRFIPGNERTINTLVNRLYKQGADVVYDAVAPVHVSGHASQDELAEMIALTRPRHFVPIHGEYRHLSRHVDARDRGGKCRRSNCFLLEDGDSLVLTPGRARRGSRSKRDAWRSKASDGGDPAVVGERRVLARDGTVTAVIVVSSKTGRIVAGPDLLSRGLVSGDGTSAHMRRAKEELTRRLGALGGPTACQRLPREGRNRARDSPLLQRRARQAAAGHSVRDGGVTAIARKEKTVIELPPPPRSRRFRSSRRRAVRIARELCALGAAGVRGVRHRQPGKRRYRTKSESRRPGRRGDRGDARRPYRISVVHRDDAGRVAGAARMDRRESRNDRARDRRRRAFDPRARDRRRVVGSARHSDGR